MNKYKAAIFDMDGVLIDSMLHWLYADVDFLKEFNATITDEMVKYFSGRSEQENMKWMKEKYNLPYSVEELIKKRERAVTPIYQEKTSLMPGVKELVNKLKNAKIRRAIASGAPIRHLNLAVDRFGWREDFETIISSDHVNFVGKPDPAIYLHTAKMMNVDPSECVVFEDAENGVVSAKAAGMSCVAIPEKRWSFGDFSKADLIAESLSDKKIHDFLGI